VVKLLLAGKADVNAKNTIDATPLHLAALNGHVDVAKLLLACGADVEAKESKYGQTPLQLAATRGHKDVEGLLRRHRAMLTASLHVENQMPISASSVNPNRIDDSRTELKWQRGHTIIFIVLTSIVLGGLVLAIVKVF
jgi:ankyrin repeat protein